MAQKAQDQYQAWHVFDIPASVMGVWMWLVSMIQQHISPTAQMARARLRAAWAALCGKDAYHGGPLLIVGEESLRGQARLAAALGGMDRALIVQKLHEWIEHNKAEGGPASTYNGYDTWIAKHFGWLSAAQMGRHIRALETMGVIVTKARGGQDRRKVYRLDYGRINALMRTPHPPTPSPTRGEGAKKQGGAKAKTGGARAKAERAAANVDDSKMKIGDSQMHDDSNRESQSPTQTVTQETPTNPTTRAGGRGRKAGTGKDAGEDNSNPSPPAPLPQGARGDTPADDQSSVEAELSTATIQDTPSPSSAPPLPQAEAALIARLIETGIDAEKAAKLIATYGANRVRAVEAECARRWREGLVHSPGGWIIMELKKDVFKLGEMDTPHPPTPSPTRGEGEASVTAEQAAAWAAAVQVVGSNLRGVAALALDEARLVSVESGVWRVRAALDGDRMLLREMADVLATALGEDVRVEVGG